MTQEEIKRGKLIDLARRIEYGDKVEGQKWRDFYRRYWAGDEGISHLQYLAKHGTLRGWTFNGSCR